MEKMKKWVSLMLVLMLALSNVLPAAAEAMASASAPIQLPVLLAANNSKNTGTSGMGGLLTGIVIKDANGNVVQEGDTVYLGDQYTFNLSFKENGPYKQFVNGQLVYQFPNNLKIEDTQNYPVFRGTTKIGEYTIQNNQLVFTPYYTKDGVNFTANQTEGSYSFVDYFGNAWLNFDFEGTFVQAGEDEEINFGGDVTVTVDIVQKTPTPKLEMTKNSELSEDKKQILYTITAKVTDADAEKLVIKDKMSSTNGIGKLKDFSVKKMPEGTEVPKEQYELTVKEGKNGEYSEFELSFKAPIPKDTEYEITYAVDVDYDYLKTRYDEVTIGANSVSGETNGGGDYKTTWGQKFEGEKKFGKDLADTDTKNQRLKWKLTIGNGQDEIPAGTEVTDNWTVSGNAAAMLDTDQDIVIKLYDSFSNVIETITIKADDPDKAQKLATYFDLMTIANGFKFKVPGSSNGTVKRCTVEYWTKVTRTDADDKQTITVENSGSYGGDGDSASGSLTPGGGQQEEKELPETKKTITSKDGEYYNFSVEVKVPAYYAEKHSSLVITDTLGVGNGAESWYLNNLAAMIKNEPDSLVIMAGSQTIPQFEIKRKDDWTWDWAAGNKDKYYYVLNQKSYNIFEIIFNKNQYGNPEWRWPVDEDVTITMTYRISKNALVKDWSGDKGKLKDIDWGYLLNGASAGGNLSVVSDKLIRSIRKSGKVVDEKQGIIEYTVNINQDFAGTLTGKPFIDTFDSNLTYVQGSFTVESRAYLWTDLLVATIKGDPNITLGTENNTLTFDMDISGNGWTVAEGDAFNHLYSFSNGESELRTIDDFKKFKRWYIDGPGKYDGKYWDGSQWVKAPRSLKITYRMQINPNVIKNSGGDSISLTNTASMEGFGSATSYVSYKPDLLDKKFLKYENGVAKYEILVNEKGLTLSDAEHPLTLTDVMTNLTPDLNSIKVYEIDANGKLTETKKPWSVQFNGSDTLTFVLPDSTPLKITYDAYPQIASGNIQVTNTATLTGRKSESSGGDTWIDVDSGSGAGGGSDMMFLIYKRDKDSKAPLSDVQFTIERYEYQKESGEKQGTWTNHGDAIVTTDSKGQVKVERFANKDTLHQHYLYRIKEVTPKAGYAAVDEYIYFTFPEGDSFETDYAAWAGVWTEKGQNAVPKDQINRLNYAGSVTVENERVQTYDFAFTKTVSSGAILSGATFTLTDTAETNPDEPQTAVSGADGKVSFTGLKPGKIYRLEETRAPGGYMLSTEIWMITVNADGTIAVKDAEGNELVQPDAGYRFDNREIPNLPSVGGSGTTAYSLLGLALMAIATAAAYALARRKKVMRPQ